MIATAADGSELFRETFAPKVVLRPYLDRFRDYEMVNVTTGWLKVMVGDEAVVDQRIATDAERFWDHFQERTIPQMYDYVMELHEGNPRGAGRDAPYFGKLQVDLSLIPVMNVRGNPGRRPAGRRATMVALLPTF